MNKTKIKNFSIWARRNLIEVVAYRMRFLGIDSSGIKAEMPGSTDKLKLYDMGTSKPAEVAGRDISKRNRLADHIQEHITSGDYKTAYETVVEEIAYTWFNRLIAIRFMEVNDYLPSGVRVLSSESGKREPDIVTQAVEVAEDQGFAITKEEIWKLKDDNKLDELFRILLIEQCKALHNVLPELFDNALDDYTDLLLPISFIDDDAFICHLVKDIDEADFNISMQGQVEIIGWLYQYYNSEKKDAVFKAMSDKVKVSKENIAAATQLFTPDWIVRYMVENSLGRLFIDKRKTEGVYADGRGLDELSWEEFEEQRQNTEKQISDEMGWKYYLPEATQTREVREQLDAIARERGDLSPEKIRFIDPCMGSGHILVYAFDVLMKIYLNRGYTDRDAARSIVQHNLWGLDLDKRAYQLAYFAIMMKGCQYDKRFLKRAIKPNLSHFQDLPTINCDLFKEPIRSFVRQFENADTYGSLISVEANDRLDEALDSFEGMLLINRTQLEHLMNLYKILSQRYDVVCTNPPYMAMSNANATLKSFVEKNYPDSKADMFAVFIEKCADFSKYCGYYAMITQHAWMFLSSYEKLREKLQFKTTINMAHLGSRAFDEISGEVVQTTAFVKINNLISNYLGQYHRLVEPNGEMEKEAAFRSGKYRYYSLQETFTKINGSPYVYWASDNAISNFEKAKPLIEYSRPRVGQNTGDNERFLRFWFEIDKQRIAFGTPHDELEKCPLKWIPYNKGGGFRRWYGNFDRVVNWANNGKEIKDFAVIRNHGKHWSRYIQNIENMCREGVSWSDIATTRFGCRYLPQGFICDVKGSASYPSDQYRKYILAFLNSHIAIYYLQMLNPTTTFQVGNIGSLPFIVEKEDVVNMIVEDNIRLSSEDWDSFETSWDFKEHPFVHLAKNNSISSTKPVRLFAKLNKERWINAINDGTICFSPINDYIEEAINEGNDEQGDMYEGVFARLRNNNPSIQTIRENVGADLEEIVDGDYILFRRLSSKSIPVFCAYGFYDEDFITNEEPIEQKDGSYIIEALITISDKMFDGFLTSEKEEDVWGFYCSAGHLTEQIEENLINLGVKYRSTIVNYSNWDKEEWFIEPTDTYPELGYKRSKFSYQKETRYILYNTHQLSKFLLPYKPIGDRSCGIGQGKSAFIFDFRVEKPKGNKISDIYKLWQQECDDRFNKLKANEEELNRIFIDIYGLQDELTPEVDDKDVTVRQADLQRDMRSFVSYAVGCMFGRYSVDVPGLVYAGGNFDTKFCKWIKQFGNKADQEIDENGELIHGGWAGCTLWEYDGVRKDGHWVKATFAPDKDNIIPITEEPFYEDDIVTQFVSFVKAVFGEDELENNLRFVAENLGIKGNGTAREKIRQYFLKEFYKDHCKIYQKRPIYWMFDTGKKNGFKALCYMHRWDVDTVGRVRIDYMHQLQRLYRNEIIRLQELIDNGEEVGKNQKRLEKITNQLQETEEYDAKIGIVVAARTEIDLDDGVKVNYDKVQVGSDGKKYQILATI